MNFEEFSTFLFQIVSVTLENYTNHQTNSVSTKEENNSQPQDQQVHEVMKVDANGSSFPDVYQKVPLLPKLMSKPDLDPTM